jgi:peptidoglycan/xylan/chitin deacetylase (PgdA/CDA1 family)
MPELHLQPRKWSLAMKLVVIIGGVVIYGTLSGALSGPLRQAGHAQLADITQNFAISYPVLKEGKVDASLQSFAQKQTDDFVAKIKDKPRDPKNKLTLSFNMLHYGKNTLSGTFDKTEEIAGQKPRHKSYLLNFDIASGKQLVVTDLFRSDVDSRKVFAMLLHDYFRYDQPDLNKDQLAKLSDLSLSDVRDFSIFEDTIAFYLNPKDLANTAAAELVMIKKSVLASVLHDTYAKNDPGRKPDAATKPVYTINTIPSPPPPAPAQTGGGGRIALTFDDGPSEHTGRLLDVLAQHQSRATFYVLGHLAQAYSGELHRMADEGHEIGNHTWLHGDLTAMSQDQLEHAIGDTQRAIQTASGGYTPRTYRPPYGATNDTVRAFAASYGLQEVLWNVDPNDWQLRDSQLIYDHIMGGAADGRVILIHDIYGSSVDAAVRAIADLKARGFQLVTVSELYGY